MIATGLITLLRVKAQRKIHAVNAGKTFALTSPNPICKKNAQINIADSLPF